MRSIAIDNPAGHGFTSPNRARRFVAQGRAVWLIPNKSIRFIALDYRHIAATKSADATRAHYDIASHSGVATLAQVAHLPVVDPARLLGFGRRKGASRHIFHANRGR